MNIILATRNPSKVDQITQIFSDPRLTVISQIEAGIEGEAVEDGETLEDNALKKAWFVYDRLPEPKGWVMADDTGLFIEALNDEPGIKAARWAGETATTDEITAHTLKQLKGIKNRRATFKTDAALISPHGEVVVFKGEVIGEILEEARTRPQPKMPYSPIFQVVGSEKVWAEMSIEEENTLSHRGKAFRRLKSYLERYL